MLVTSKATDLRQAVRPVCAAIGIFDGVHLGHQALLATARSEASRQGGSATVITFDRHPNAIVAPERNPPLLQTLRQRLRVLESLQLDVALVIPFNLEVSQQPAETFLHELSVGVGRLGSLCVGEGFTFGHCRRGDVELLKRLAAQWEFTVQVLPPVCVDGVAVRSTRIRELIQAGQFESASTLLGRPYTLAGPVVPGDRIGRALGFPTANLEVDGLALPPTGVYAVRVEADGATRPGVLNLGFRPTLQRAEPTLHCEVHILDYTGDLYGREVEMTPVIRLRDEQRFPSRDDLRQQISRDVEQARKCLG